MKRVFGKKPLAVAPLQDYSAEQLGISGVFRPQVNAPVTMLGLALSLGASASLVSIPEMALAADGSSLEVLPAVDRDMQNGGQRLQSSPGQEAATAYYTVTEGDSLWQIASDHAADVDTLKAVNGLSSDEVLRVGQVLRVPNGDLGMMASQEGSLESLVKAKSILGGVGGEIPALMPHPSAVAVLSVDQLEGNLPDLDAQLSDLDREEIQQDPDVQNDQGLDTAAQGKDLGQAKATDTTAPAPAALKAREDWQDATVHLASAASSDPAPAPRASELESGQPVAAAFPESLPLNSESQSRLSRRPGSTATTTASSRAQVSPAEDRSQPLAMESTPAAAPITQASAARVETLAAPDSREQAIQQHLARIRNANSATIDREALNARIRQAREELQLARAVPAEPVARSTASAPVGNAPRAGQPSAAPQPLATLTPAAITPDSAKEGSLQSQGWTVTDVAATEDEAESRSILALAPAASQPEDNTAGDLQARPDLSGARGSRELLAAAPMGAEAYRPFPAAPTGQMVSPGMPMLPAADQFLPEAPNRFSGYIWPTRGTLTSGYGWRWGRMHRGVDIAGPVGTPIMAAASGIVVRSGWNSGGYGNLVDIRHADGSMTRYAHNSRLLVREGQQVAQGQQIAEMGSTGFSTGPHLHFEIHLPNSGTVNPMAFLPGR